MLNVSQQAECKQLCRKVKQLCGNVDKHVSTLAALLWKQKWCPNRDKSTDAGSCLLYRAPTLIPSDSLGLDHIPVMVPSNYFSLEHAETLKMLLDHEGPCESELNRVLAELHGWHRINPYLMHVWQTWNH